MVLSERERKREDHDALHEAFLHALRQCVNGYDSPRVLDYGGGDYELFTNLHPRQRTLVFDPHSNPDHARFRSVPWTPQKPIGKFDIVICHFSLHHIENPPAAVIAEIDEYEPQFVAIADYDYRDSLRGEFEDTFVTDAEQRELQTTFKGDSVDCYYFHSRYGIDDYKRALGQNGYGVKQERVGQGNARHKFFLIGHLHPQLRMLLERKD